MDWPGSRTMFGYDKLPAEEEVDDGEEDFYGLSANTNGINGESHVFPGASEHRVNGTNTISSQIVQDQITETAQQPATPSAEQRKTENQKKAADLRAKLIAQRQNTPVKGVSRPNTPSKFASAPRKEPRPESKLQEMQSEQNEPSSDIFGLESLLAEGKAAAEAKMKQSEQLGTQKRLASSSEESPHAVAPATNPDQDHVTVPSISQNVDNKTEGPIWATKLTDAYYADLPIWLEVTAYHDVEYRDSKLRTYKERKALEEEAARIAQRLEKLKQAEQAEIASLRSVTAHSTTATPFARPPLPETMPGGSIIHQTPTNNPITTTTTSNGTKRAHSPEPIHSEKSIRRGAEPPTVRARGPRDSPESRPVLTRRGQNPLSTGLERRISYPEARRRSSDDFHPGLVHKTEPRDPSLERRQAYYKRESGTPTSSYNRDNRFDRVERTVNDAVRGYENGARASFGGTERASAGSGHRDLSQYRGSAGLDLRKGGQSSHYYPR